MKKILFTMLFFLETCVFGYFDGALNWTTGKDGYVQQDVYLLFGKEGLWLKPSWLSWKSNSTDTFNSFAVRVGFEKPSYTLAFTGGFIPEKSGYKNVSIGGDITFSLNPTSSSRKRLAGPNSGFISRSASGVTQLDFGASAALIAHNYIALGADLNEINTSLFAGAKVFLTQISINYSLSTYDKESLAKTQITPTQRISGINSVFPVFIKSSFNARVEIPQSPLVTPYLSYNRIKTKRDESVDVYALGAYIDLAMVGVTIQLETYKDINSKTQRYLSLGAGVRF
ncbi:MAG: hypothetical protein ACP5PA_03865 [Elusimicrobiales bacterium]